MKSYISWKSNVVACVTAASMLFTSTIVSSQEASAASSSGRVECKDYVMLVVPGTSEVERGGRNQGMLKTVTSTIAQQNNDFLVQVVDYPASIGGLIAPIYGSNTPFSDSVKEGIDLTINYALEYKKRCPGVKFGMMGYSQGALVAGDVAEIVGNGKAEGLSGDDFIGALLYADPRRARSQIDGQQVQREGSEKTIKSIVDPVMEGEGIFGYRKDFGTMTSKTVSFCNTLDVVCNVSEDSRKAADFVAALAEYNTGTNIEQLEAFQDIGYGESSRNVAHATTSINGSPIVNPEEIANERMSNPGSIIAMVTALGQLAPNFIEDDPAAAISQAFGFDIKATDGDTTKILKSGIDMESMKPLLAELAASSLATGHGLYPSTPVDEKGTTMTQWGGNWLAARME